MTKDRITIKNKTKKSLSNAIKYVQATIDIGNYKRRKHYKVTFDDGVYVISEYSIKKNSYTFRVYLEEARS